MVSFSSWLSSASRAWSSDEKAIQNSSRLQPFPTKPHFSIPAFDPLPILAIESAHSLAEGIGKIPASTRSPQMRRAVRLPMLGNKVDFVILDEEVSHLKTCFTVGGFSDFLKRSFHSRRFSQYEGRRDSCRPV